jgi:hypothetical protein
VWLMHGERRWIEINPLMTVYKGRDGRRSGVIAIPEGEVEGSRPMVLEGNARVQALEVGGHKSEKSKRRLFQNYHCQNQGGMCYRHNLIGPKDRLRASRAEGKHGHSLQIGFCANMLRAKMAVYLRIV